MCVYLKIIFLIFLKKKKQGKADSDDLISSFLKKELISFVLKTYSNLDYEDAENYVTAMFSYRFAKIVYIYIK